MTNNIYDSITGNNKNADRQSACRTDSENSENSERELSPYTLSLINNLLHETAPWKCRDTLNTIGDIHGDIIRALNSLTDMLNSSKEYQSQFDISPEDTKLVQTLNRFQWNLDKCYYFVKEAGELYQDTLREMLDVYQNRMTYEKSAEERI